MPEISSISLPIPIEGCASSKTCCDKNAACLPNYLHNTDPLELEDLPLQVALLTHELANMRTAQAQMARLLTVMADLLTPRGWNDG